jgi:hypothetical protein
MKRIMDAIEVRESKSHKFSLYVIKQIFFHVDVNNSVEMQIK